MLKKVWIFMLGCGFMQQGFAAVAASFWQIRNQTESDVVIEFERFLRLLFVEDQQSTESMKKTLVSVEKLSSHELLALLNSRDDEGNTFFEQVILAWPQVHNNNKEVYLDFIRLLISYGINLNRQNQQGNTCLHLAYQVKSAEIVGILALTSSVDQTIKNKRGEVPARQIESSRLVSYEPREIPSIGENLYWCFKVMCIVADGECM
jgi:hypothetical protein